MQTKKQYLGTWGESLAISFLEKKGYHIVQTNYQIRGAEIDIIAWHEKPHHGRTLCFVEVKTRSRWQGSAERTVGWQKRQHIERAATMYCLRHKIASDTTPIQFETITIYTSPRGSTIRHYELPAH